jgi:hypothetical protein
MPRPQVADGGKTPSMEYSCEYIEYDEADVRQGLFFQMGEELTNLHIKKRIYYETVNE